MKINIDGRGYSFKFQHHTSGIERGTVCRVYNEEGVQVTQGVANVHPHDNYCKEKGRKIALSRAISDWDKPYRTQVWDEYRTWGAKDRW